MENPLTAIPEVLPGIEAKVDARGFLQLRKQRLYTGGMGRALAFRLRWQADAKVQLDEYGSFFWQQIDGQQTLDDIAAAFATRYGRTEPDSRRAVVQFTRDLMLRRLITLSIPAPTS